MDFCPKHDTDTYLCQFCGTVHCEECDGRRPAWVEGRGNMCPACGEKAPASGRQNELRRAQAWA